MLRKKDQFVYVENFSKDKYELVSSTDLLKKTSKLVNGKTKYFVEQKEIATFGAAYNQAYITQRKKKEKPYLARAKKIEDKHIQKFKVKQLYFDSVDQNGLHKEVPATLMKYKDYTAKKEVVIEGQTFKVTTGHVLYVRYKRRNRDKIIKNLEKAHEAKLVTLEVPLTKPQQNQEAKVQTKLKRKAQDDLQITGQQELIEALLNNKRPIQVENLHLLIKLFYQYMTSCAQQVIQSSSIDDNLHASLGILFKSEKEINDSIDECNKLNHQLGVPGVHFTKVSSDYRGLQFSVPVPPPIASSTPLVTVEAKAASTSSSSPEPAELLDVEELLKLSEEIEPIINPPRQIQVSQNPNAFFNSGDDFAAMCLTQDSIPSETNNFNIT